MTVTDLKALTDDELKKVAKYRHDALRQAVEAVAEAEQEIAERAPKHCSDLLCPTCGDPRLTSIDVVRLGR